RRARSRVVQPAQAAPEAAAQPLRVLSAGDRGWWVGWLDGPPGRSVQCRRSLCDPRPGGRQLLHGGHESLPQEGQGAPPGCAGRRPQRGSATPQADRCVSVHQVHLQLGRGYALSLAGRLTVRSDALRRWVLIVALLTGLWAGLNGAKAAEELVVYSGRKEIVVKPVVEAFQKMTGVAVKLKIGPTSGLANALIQEKARPRADVFIATEAGVMEILAKNGVLDAYVSPESKDLLPGSRDREGLWTGISSRARVIIYNKNLVPDKDVPRSVFQLIDPRWKGKIAIAGTQERTTLSWVSSLIAVKGAQFTKN